LRAALVLARRRLVKACNTVQSAGSYYDKILQNVGPILSEFADVLPEGAARSLESVQAMASERRADLDTACKVCKREFRSAIKDVSSRLGVEGQIRQALQPLENMAPQWLVASPVAQALVAVGIVLVGGGLAAGIGAVASGGGTEEATTADPGGGAGIVNNPGGSPGTGAAGSLPDACDLVTVAEVEELLGPVEVDSISGSEGSQCLFQPVDPNEGCHGAGVRVEPEEPLNLDGSASESLGGLGDEAYWLEFQSAVYVRQGDTWLIVHTVTGPPDCGSNILPEHFDRRREEAINLTEAAISRVP
jgi:hypothetical protein